MKINRPGVALFLLIVGSLLAGLIQTSGGAIKVHDVRFADSGGNLMSGLLYVPSGDNANSKAPGVLAIHGYINSRETQSGFAGGFGGPAGLAFLRSLPFVDKDKVGLEGHSMGGWASLMAAAAYPDG